MIAKHWVSRAREWLEESLNPLPHELNELDWKAQATENKDRLAEHLMAFANHPDGGVLVFGMRPDGTPLGVDQTTVEQLSNSVANLGRDAVEPPIAADHAVVEYDGVPLLFIHIPEQAIKPVHRRGRPIDETWIRSAGTTRRASRQEVGALMLNSATPHWEGLRASSAMDLEQVRESLDIGVVATLLQRPLPEEESDLLRWLQDEGIVELVSRRCYVTNFGAIAAARRLEDFGALDRKSVRVIRYQGTNKVNAIDEQPGRRGYAVGFNGLIAYLTRVLPHSEVIRQSLRTEVSIYPEIALRELIANALIHQDFSITGAGPMVEIYDDRIEITNPGRLLPGKRPDRLIGTTPESRNEHLASSFRRYRICEERGTGFQKVVAAIEIFGMPPLLISPQDNAFRVTLFAPRKFSKMSHEERVEAAYQHAVLQYLSSKTLTNTSLRERFKLHEKHRNQITNLIGEAVRSDRIKRKGSGGGKKFAEYVPYWA